VSSTFVFAGVVAVAVALLMAAFAFGPVADSRHAVVTVDGVTIDRTELRNRLKLDQSLASARKDVLQAA
jgi:hypothetical protein